MNKEDNATIRKLMLWWAGISVFCGFIVDIANASDKSNYFPFGVYTLLAGGILFVSGLIAGSIVALAFAALFQVGPPVVKFVDEQLEKSEANKNAWHSLRQGLTKTEVKQMLGEPSQIVHDGLSEAWHFRRGFHKGICVFVNDVLIQFKT